MKHKNNSSKHEKKVSITHNGWTNFNPLSANGDQHQFSPNDIHNLSRDWVMRINKMINNQKIP